MYPKIQLTPPEPYAVYVLECGKPPELGDAEERIQRHYPTPPNWLYAAMRKSSLYYVGSTSRIQERLIEHIDNAKSGATFTDVFEPYSLWDVSWHQSYREAVDAEESKAREMSSELSNAFVYQG